MKKNILTSLALFLAAALLFVSCRKEDEAAVMPIVKTLTITGITDSTAIAHGYIVQGAGSVTEEGICFSSTEKLPTVDAEKAISTDETAEIVGEMKNLAYKTRYYYRAYAIHAGGIEYGDTMSFISSIRLAVVTAAEATAITGYSAKVSGEVTDLGGGTVSAKGLCWTRDSLPTIKNDSTIEGEGLGIFSSDLTDLIGGSTYYVRAYAINEAGVSYSESIEFTTLNYAPIVTSDSIRDITKTTANVYGNVLYTGGANITEKGFSYGTAADALNTDVTVSGTTTGKMSASLSGLDAGVTYFVAAYAENSQGRAYGDTLEFTTVANIWKFWVVGDYNGWDNSDNALYLLSTASSTEAEGYVNFTSTGGFKLTTDHSWSDPATFGDQDDDGINSGILVNPGANILINPAGYYLIKADGENMTYSLTETNWAATGSATPNGWPDPALDHDMTYDQTNKIWYTALTLTADELKFRANDGWTYNFGDNGADGSLEYGGANIAITIAGDYAITLDLSTPQNYTYSANTWGIIGDFNGWGDDVNMTWDAGNSVFTADITVASAGGFKFRANDSWDAPNPNYGDIDGNGTLDTEPGNNISIAPGNYTITLDPWALTYTVTAN
ncbi:MAG: SusF/SusE family outer membrane protein [Chloroflexia bacterium]|nr:SusF/SusE family outer membrane protein [Chloroflexia bacterium]